MLKEFNLKSESGSTRFKIITQLSIYLVASIIGTALHYLILYSLVQFFALGTVVSSTCGALAGALTIYLLNYFLVFKSTRRHRDALTRFLLVACLGVLLNGLILKQLTLVSDWHYLVLQVITTAIVFASNFALNRGWTFSAKKSLQETPP